VDATLKAAFQGASVTSFTAVSIAINGGATIRLCNAGFVDIGGDTFSVEDATYGILGDMDPLSDGSDGQATNFEITLHPPSLAAVSALAAASAQGSPVIVYQGAVDPETGLSIGTVETLVTGELNRTRRLVGRNSAALVLICSTQEARLLERNEEWNLSDAFHQSIWSGELGEDGATGLPSKVYWRAVDPATTAIKSNKFFGVNLPR
jgi:hypothetical protein